MMDPSSFAHLRPPGSFPPQINKRLIQKLDGIEDDAGAAPSVRYDPFKDPLRFLQSRRVAPHHELTLSVPSSFAVDRRRRSCPGDPNARFPTPRPPSTPRSSPRHRNPTPGSTTRSPSQPTSASCYSRTKRTSSIACESTHRSCTPTRTPCGPGRRRAARNVRRAGCATRRTERHVAVRERGGGVRRVRQGGAA